MEIGYMQFEDLGDFGKLVSHILNEIAQVSVYRAVTV